MRTSVWPPRAVGFEMSTSRQWYGASSYSKNIFRLISIASIWEAMSFRSPERLALLAKKGLALPKKGLALLPKKARAPGKKNGRRIGRRPLSGRTEDSLATAPLSVCHACTSRPRPYSCAPTVRSVVAWSLLLRRRLCARRTELLEYHAAP